MKKRLLAKVRCPNTRRTNFILYGREVATSDGLAWNLEDQAIAPDADVRTGILLQPESGRVYPITQHVLSMLADQDADLGLYEAFWREARAWAPPPFADAIDHTLGALRSSVPNATGEWNRQERAYYDREVATDELRADLLTRMLHEPLWHIYIERERQMLRQLRSRAMRNVLEIGCGNARTIFSLLRPREHGFEYVGTDISFQRLLLARTALPESDFVQCSALELPFVDDSFDVVISFGMLHHLPSSVAGVREAARTLESGGAFTFTEPLKRPRLLNFDAPLWVRRILTTYEHSTHDGTVDIGRVAETLASEGLQLGHVHYSGSVVRTVLSRLLRVSSKLRQRRAIWLAVIRVDGAFNWLLCRTPNRLGPKVAFMTWTRREPID